MDISLCREFRGLDPIKLRRYRGSEVFLLARRLHRYNDMNFDEKGKPRERTYRRKATAWF